MREMKPTNKILFFFFLHNCFLFPGHCRINLCDMICKRKRKKFIKKSVYWSSRVFLWGLEWQLRDRQAGLAHLVHFNLI